MTSKDETSAIVRQPTQATGVVQELVYQEGSRSLAKNWSTQSFPFHIPDYAKIDTCRLADELGVSINEALSIAVQSWFSSNDFARQQQRRRKKKTTAAIDILKSQPED